MFRITQEVTFCYGHRILHHGGKCRYLHGHNARAVVTLRADRLDDLGMVMDLTQLKQHLANWIDENLDHRMVLHRDDPMVPVLRDHGEPIVAIDANPTVENLAKLIFDRLADEGLPVSEVRLWETFTSSASYTSD